MAKCVAADNSHFSGQQLQLALASLNAIGCYAVGNSVLLPPPYGNYGNTKSNMFRDAGFRDADFSVTKAFTFKERLKVEGRVEFFNIFNHPTFSNPSGGPGGAIGDPCGGPQSQDHFSVAISFFRTRSGLVFRFSCSPDKKPFAVVAVGKWESAGLADFQARWKSPFCGLFHGATFPQPGEPLQSSFRTYAS